MLTVEEVPAEKSEGISWVIRLNGSPEPKSGQENPRDCQMLDRNRTLKGQNKERKLTENQELLEEKNPVAILAAATTTW